MVKVREEDVFRRIIAGHSSYMEQSRQSGEMAWRVVSRPLAKGTNSEGRLQSTTFHAIIVDFRHRRRRHRRHRSRSDFEDIDWRQVRSFPPLSAPRVGGAAASRISGVFLCLWWHQLFPLPLLLRQGRTDRLQKFVIRQDWPRNNCGEFALCRHLAKSPAR